MTYVLVVALLALAVATLPTVRSARLIPWIIAAFVLVPSVATATWFPRAGSLHPASIATAVMLAVSLVKERRRWYLSSWLPHRRWWVMVAIVVVVVALDTLRVRTQGTTLLVNNIVAPLVLCLAIQRQARDDPRRARRLPLLVVGLGALETLVALAVRVGLLGQPFAHQLATYYWFRQVVGIRSMGSMDHPLLLGMLLAMAVPLCMTLRPWWLRGLAVVTLVLGIGLTGSRTALVLAGLAGLAVGWQTLARLRDRAIMVAAALLAVGLALLGPLRGVLTRFGNDDGSTSIRLAAYRAFAQVWPDHLVLGRGSYGSARLAAELGLPGSFESALMSYSIDYGILATVAYFATMIALVWWARPRWWALAAFAICLVQVATFSSLSNNNTAGLVLWSAAGLAMACRRPARPDAPAPGGAHAHRR